MLIRQRIRNAGPEVDPIWLAAGRGRFKAQRSWSVRCFVMGRAYVFRSKEAAVEAIRKRQDPAPVSVKRRGVLKFFREL